MSRLKFYTLEDLVETGLPMLDGGQSKDWNIGDVFLKDRVINMWDLADYKPYYTYSENGIEHVVEIVKAVDNRVYAGVRLLKDLSNIKHFEEA